MCVLGESLDSLRETRVMEPWLRFATYPVLGIQCCGDVSKSFGECRLVMVEAASLIRSRVAADLYVKIQRLGRSARLVNYARMRAWCVSILGDGPSTIVDPGWVKSRGDTKINVRFLRWLDTSHKIALYCSISKAIWSSICKILN